MKKTFYPKRNALLTGGTLSAGVVVLSVAVFLLLIRLLFPGTLIALASPFMAAGTSLAQDTRTVFASFSSTKALLQEETALQSQNAALAAENAMLAAKAADLSRMLGGENTASPGMIAGVIARPPESPYDTLIIGSGAQDGVERGERAYGPGGVPLGSVESVMPHAARIVLFSAPGVSIDGWAGAMRAPVTIIGEGGGAFSARTSRSSSIAAGDAVYIAGPGALPIGTVADIASDPSSPIETLHIKPALNLFSITWVELRGQGSSAWPNLLIASSTAP